MTVSKEIQPIFTLGDEFRICPKCGYNRGFHLSLVKKEREEYDNVFICPECGSRYSVGWSVRLP